VTTTSMVERSFIMRPNSDYTVCGNLHTQTTMVCMNLPLKSARWSKLHVLHG
jgi:hypothetical protein